jgi:hypothetical protein
MRSLTTFGLTPAFKARALGALADAAVQAGRQVEDILELLADSHGCGYLLTIAESLADQGKVREARAVVAHAWTAGCSSYAPVGVLASVDRQLLYDIAEETLNKGLG